MKRLILRLAATLTLVLSGAAMAASPASASVGPVGYYPNQASCVIAGEQGKGVAWPWYSCSQNSLGVWVLSAPGFGFAD